MLILIAGITGNIGHRAASYALSQSHSVRGLGRSASKLPSTLTPRLESFVPFTSYYDIAALDTACASVDAVICAYSGLPELHLDAQLLLLRAAERAGVTRFLAAGWNYDWRVLRLGEEPVYDAIMMFHAQMQITSAIRPCHVFSGMLVGVFFGEYFLPGDMGGVWDGRIRGEGGGRRVMDVWGTGDEMWDFTTEEDAAKWGVEVVTAPGAEQGGFVSVRSFEMSLNQLRDVYEKVRGVEVEVTRRGTVEELQALAEREREVKGGARNFWEWHRLWFHLFCVQQRWNLKDLQNARFGFEPMGLEQYLRENPEI